MVRVLMRVSDRHRTRKATRENAKGTLPPSNRTSRLRAFA